VACSLRDFRETPRKDKGPRLRCRRHNPTISRRRFPPRHEKTQTRFLPEAPYATNLRTRLPRGNRARNRVATQLAVGTGIGSSPPALLYGFWSGAIKGPSEKSHSGRAGLYCPQGIERPKESDPFPMVPRLGSLGAVPPPPTKSRYVPLLLARPWTDSGVCALRDMGSLPSILSSAAETEAPTASNQLQRSLRRNLSHRKHIGVASPRVATCHPVKSPGITAPQTASPEEA